MVLVHCSHKPLLGGKTNKMLKQIKQHLKSRSVWIGIITFLVGVLSMVQDQLVAGTAVSVLGIAMIIVRNLTKLPLTEK